MIVKKFGGTSVKDATAIRRVIEICKREVDSSIVVVSAFAGVTNSLVDLFEAAKNLDLVTASNIINSLQSRHILTATELNCSPSTINYISDLFSRLQNITDALAIVREFTPRSNAVFLATGELLSSLIIADAFTISGLDSQYIDSTGTIITEEKFLDAEVNHKLTRAAIKEKLSNLSNTSGKFVVCGGFIASTPSGQISTLGRGGSDYTAAIIAEALDASRLEIWTDVDGILTCDPRTVSNTRLIKEISYNEAAELAFYGAKVLHPKTIYPAVEAKIPVYVLNSFNPENTGTKIVSNVESTNIIKAIAFRKSITVINVSSNRMLGTYGFLSKVFDVFKSHRIPIDLVSTSEVSISMTVESNAELNSVINELETFSKVDIYLQKAIISAVGDGIRNASGIAARFCALTGINVSMISFGASEVNLSIIVDENDVENAVVKLHSEFFN